MVIHMRIKPAMNPRNAEFDQAPNFPSKVPFISSCGTMPALVTSTAAASLPHEYPSASTRSH